MTRLRRPPLSWLGLAVLLFLAGGGVLAQTREQRVAIAALPELYRQWVEEVTVLISKAELASFLTLDKDYQRDAFIDRFWEVRDPYPDTARNELRERWEERVTFARQNFGDLKEDRARMLLLNGPPDGRLNARCSGTLWPLEIWFYEGSERVRDRFVLVFVQRGGLGPYRIWQPAEGLTALAQFAGQMTNAADIIGLIRNGCLNGDEIAGAIAYVARQGALGYMTLLSKLETPPPAPKGEWVATFATYSTDLPEGSSSFKAEVAISYPSRRQSRTVVQGLVTVATAEAGKAEIGDAAAYNFVLTGEVLRGRKLFDSFRYKFDFPAGAATGGVGDGARIPMIFERYLRPGAYTLILKLEDLNAHKFFRQQVDVEVPLLEATDLVLPPADEASARLLAEANAAIQSGENTLKIVESTGELQTGLVRFDTLTTGRKPASVVFSLNGKPILTKRSPPFSVELDLGTLPRAHLLRVASLDESGKELASDETRINAYPNRFALRFVEPKPGGKYSQSLRAEVVVELPEGDFVERVEMFLDETRVATLYQPPYTQAIVLPAGEPIAYVRAVAYLPDGNSTERVVFINTPEYLEEVEVDFVELFTTVVDGIGRPVDGLGEGDFRIFEDGVEQKVARFERVENLPVHVEIALDISASMEDKLETARQAALRFMETTIQPKDRAAVVTFNDRPTLVVKSTNDLSALAGGLAGLKAERGTALYDSLIFALYYLNGVKGQRAVLILSDGKDESSRFRFEDTIDYARRAGVAIYPIGVELGRGERDARKKLERFAEETGGAAFFIESIDELAVIYAQIQKELRSKYFLAYQSTNTSRDEKFRGVEVRIVKPGLEAKTIRGYYP